MFLLRNEKSAGGPDATTAYGNDRNEFIDRSERPTWPAQSASMRDCDNVRPAYFRRIW